MEGKQEQQQTKQNYKHKPMIFEPLFTLRILQSLQRTTERIIEQDRELFCENEDETQTCVFTSPLRTISESEEPLESPELHSEVQRTCRIRKNQSVTFRESEEQWTTEPTRTTTVRTPHSVRRTSRSSRKMNEDETPTISESEEPLESPELHSEVQRTCRIRKNQSVTFRESEEQWTTEPTRSTTVRTPHSVRRTSRSSRKMVELPQWLVNLMFDIEEATTHELTIE